MGIINHNAVAATTYSDDAANDLRAWIADLTDQERLLFAECGSWVNGYYTFFLAPDGSKEGWSDSDAGDALRERLIEWLQEKSRSFSRWEWVEVSYGEFGQKVTRGNNEDCYA